MRAANLAIKFLLELAAFAGLAGGGWHLGDGGAAGIVLAVVLPVTAIAVWGRWCAPKAAHRLRTSTRAPLELVVLLLGAAGWATASPVVGAVVAAVVVLNAVGLTAWQQWEA